jgi:23S rRNA (adenine1618-N6)-methyltransferase
MKDNIPKPSAEKPGFHPHNPHRFRYNFEPLISVCPELAPFVKPNNYNTESVDFANPEAVKMLNRAILKLHYKLEYWDVPANYLCPPIPSRADYIFHVADLLASGNKGIIPTGKTFSVLDIGVGANCIYPIIGHQTFGWHFVGSDIDEVAIRVAQKIIDSNNSLNGKIELRLQSKASNIFSNILNPDEMFDLSICNPPFHSSQKVASEGTDRKNRNLKTKTEKIPVLNFGGQSTELWCDGGEAEFLRRMVKQSSEIPDRVKWFTSLVSKKSNLPAIYKALQKAGSKKVRTIEMVHGQKQSRIIAWTFLTENESMSAI